MNWSTASLFWMATLWFCRPTGCAPLQTTDRAPTILDDAPPSVVQPQHHRLSGQQVEDAEEPEQGGRRDEDADEDAEEGEDGEREVEELSDAERRRLFAQHSLQALRQLAEPARPKGTAKRAWLQRHQRQQLADVDVEGAPDKSDVLELTSAHRLNRNQSCQGDLFKHRIRLVGCIPKVIYNRFCHGSCSSFYIPKLRTSKLKATFQSCAACVPVETDTVKVTLECPERAEGRVVRSVVRVKRCECRNVELVGAANADDEDEGVSL